jgi:hypothetical protein
LRLALLFAPEDSRDLANQRAYDDFETGLATLVPRVDGRCFPVCSCCHRSLTTCILARNLADLDLTSPRSLPSAVRLASGMSLLTRFALPHSPWPPLLAPWSATMNVTWNNHRPSHLFLIIFHRRFMTSIASIWTISRQCSHKSPRDLHHTSDSSHTTTPKHTPISITIVSIIATSPIITSPCRKHPLKSERNFNPKLLEQAMQCTSCTDQRHHHCHKSFERVSLCIIPEIADQALELVYQTLDIAIARSSFVV